jgi:hypothetical protein
MTTLTKATITRRQAEAAEAAEAYGRKPSNNC